MTQKAIAKECADWNRQKGIFKSNITTENMAGFLNVENEKESFTYLPLNGFTTVDLGCERGNNAYNIVNRLEAHSVRAMKIFNQMSDVRTGCRMSLKK